MIHFKSFKIGNEGKYGLKELSYDTFTDHDGSCRRVIMKLTDGSEVFIAVERGIKAEDLRSCYLDLNDNNILVIRKAHNTIFDDTTCIAYIEANDEGDSIETISQLHHATSVRYMKFSKADNRKSCVVVYTYRAKFKIDNIGQSYINEDYRGTIKVNTKQYSSQLLDPIKERHVVPSRTDIRAALTSTKINNIIYVDKTISTIDLLEVVAYNFGLYNLNSKYCLVTDAGQLNAAMRKGYLNEIYTVQTNNGNCNVNIEKIIETNDFAHRYRINTINVNVNKNKISMIVTDKKERL